MLSIYMCLCGVKKLNLSIQSDDITVNVHLHAALDMEMETVCMNECVCVSVRESMS